MLTKNFSEVAKSSWAFTRYRFARSCAACGSSCDAHEKNSAMYAITSSTSASGQGTKGSTSRYTFLRAAMPLTLFQHQTKIKRA